MRLLPLIAMAVGLWSGCKAQSVLPTGSIDECFPKGRPGYHAAFLSKVRFPHDSLRTKENSGTVYFEIEVDTHGRIVDFQVIRSVNAVLDNEVRAKLQLTDGMWKPMVIDGRASNYKIRDKVYFEIR